LRLKIKNMKKAILILAIAATALEAAGTPRFAKPKKEESKLIFAPRKISMLKNDDKEELKGRFLITAGAGFNLLSTSLTIKYAFHYVYDITSANAGPIFHAGVDYGILKNLSAGIDAGYQNASVGLRYYDDNGDMFTYYDYWKRYYFAARVDYHIIARNNINFYTGLRLGYNSYSVNASSTRPYQAFYTPSQLNLATGIIHAHIGFSYFFKGIVGLNAEAGLGYGGPFIGSVGICAKI
jgi:hypothetical protein